MQDKLKEVLRKTWLYKQVGRHVWNWRDQRFDAKYGIDTSGRAALCTLSITSSNVVFGNYYEAIDPRFFHKILRPLKIRHEEFVFVDFGSGKGRAVLLASEYPFKRIVGIEFARELHRIAQDNIRRYKSAVQKCHAIESLCTDAINYPIPDGPVVLFFYNPFGEKVLAPVLANILASIKAHPRDVFVIYVNPLLDHLLKRNNAFIEIATSPWHHIYRGAT